MCAQRDRKPGFDSEFDGITLKIRLRGEIDHHTAAVVRVNMDELIRSRAPRVLAIDMSAVDFMDSSGLGLIMGRYNTMKEIGGGVTVADPNPATEKIMNLAGLERIIKIKRSGVRVPSRCGSGMARATMSTGDTGRAAGTKKEIEGKKNEKSKI